MRRLDDAGGMAGTVATLADIAAGASIQAVTHVRIWQFEPCPGREREFAAAYASEGAWAELFQQAEGFIGTTLLAPAEPGGSWLTIDRWESKLAFEQFQASLGEAYRSLDDTLSELTAAEHFIGAFDDPP